MHDSRPLSIPLILGTPRQGRLSEHVARVIIEQATAREDVQTELIDVRQLALPSSDAGEQIKDKRLAETIMRADGLIIVAPEYNHGYPGMLKHALDSNLKEYIHKPVGLCGELLFRRALRRRHRCLARVDLADSGGREPLRRQPGGISPLDPRACARPGNFAVVDVAQLAQARQRGLALDGWDSSLRQRAIELLRGAGPQSEQTERLVQGYIVSHAANIPRGSRFRLPSTGG